ncbi:MAG: 4-alpha-glucanotransferase [Lachnospiraceae bacterium]|nr:4-alpha-glucanotransferase [Lachnospiraceae bacterium]
MLKRSCGVLLPVTSLPSAYGIGCLSREAYAFVGFLEEAGQSYWQILPLGQTGYGDSPYQSFSTFAGNPYLIDPGVFVEKGYITEADAAASWENADAEYVDYERMYRHRYPLLKKAYHNSPFSLTPAAPWNGREYDDERKDFEAFLSRSEAWLPDYALYCAVKEHFGGKCFVEWEDGIRSRDPEACRYYRELLADEIRYVSFLQYCFDTQWYALKFYANSRGVRIIGDIPIYVAFDSADTWSHPELFELDEEGYPTVVAGCPPDAFSETGQLWGNPIYRWDRHRQTGYAWWINRLRRCFALYDMVRIDHFRGFDEYYAIPYGARMAMNGAWRQGPGYDLFREMERQLGKQEIIAEDLGYLTPSVHELLAQTGYPGMKVLQFAFDTAEDSDYLPHNYPKNCVVYTGTHDNDTTRGWFDSQPEWVKDNVRNYCGTRDDRFVVDDMVRLALRSRAALAVIPMQDYLELGGEARINIPSTLGINWKWRMLPDMCTEALAERMRELARTYRRL